MYIAVITIMVVHARSSVTFESASYLPVVSDCAPENSIKNLKAYARATKVGLSTKIINENYQRKLSTKIINENYQRKLSTKIINENYQRKLSTKI